MSVIDSITNEVKEKQQLSKTDRYNYRKLENIHVEDYENRILEFDAYPGLQNKFISEIN